ncbi:hypothetical protein M8C21_022208 [Ambrosia artemisiifolia]|uniref:non-specific serine/threonine protein kinase n=1 Tax=Ambrosia artemisiifolia TaxID=4212 RepID=A0AAD5CSJ0_AMBAR|nr:hypothetical protein M8C21_022208 [Ambrosia artemisiifolia]
MEATAAGGDGNRIKLRNFVVASWLWLIIMATIAQAQNTTLTDPAEARVIHEMFRQWGIKESEVANMRWNLSGEPCSGAAVDSTTFDNNTRVYSMDAVGLIPEGLWTLVYLTNLTMGINALSGELPPELGQLSDLRLLGIGTNNFNGSVPSELGNLRRLQQLAYLYTMSLNKSFSYIDSSGVGGGLRATLSKLLGCYECCRRISGLSNGTLDFIKDLKSLGVLVLRNNKISGSIPTDIGEHHNLTRLDLSFNDLNGEIPRGLFNLSQLSFLFLGNNSLNGILPDVKSASLRNIDVSYNELSGTLPSWVNEANLQLNLVVNNFTLGDSGNSGLPSDSDFGINCGGPPITSSNQLLHEEDREALGATTYYVTSERRWGVSNVGQSDRPRFTGSSSRQFTGTLDSELFQTARLSAGSLRYYGLGLENGNYTVTLQFAELEIEDGRTWKSTGRRVFDIYLQGNLAFQDFDIRRAAGGAAFRPVSRQATVHVTDNYLEIHIFWSGKGTCCVPKQGTFGPLISAISATPNFRPSVSNTPPSTKKNGKNRTGLIVGIVVPIAFVSFLSLLVLYIFRQRRKKQDAYYKYEEFFGIDTRPDTFSYGDLRDATDGFSPANKLGEGGFGPVYKGTLNDGRVIAVKQLSVASHQGKGQFIAEISTISAVQHRNLVKLYGCCIEGDKRLLVYEYLENNSLDHALFGDNRLFLSWATRFEICLGIARGLAYLHEESRMRVVHRDVKASNILLDSELNPKISDFGLAKLYDDKKTHMSTQKADVFGFGVVALEIISGRPNSDSSLEDEKVYLLEWAWNLHETNSEVELVDEELSEYDENEVKRVTRIALLCTQTSPTQRPSMSQVVVMLSGDIEVVSVITRPGYLSGFNFRDTTTFKSAASTLGAGSMPSTGQSTVLPSSPDNPSRLMLHNVIGEGR